MKDKGFTLPEVLAVISIIGIIAVIATPIILGVLNKAKLQSKERTSELIGDSIETAYSSYTSNSSTFAPNKLCEYLGEKYFYMENVKVDSCSGTSAILKSGKDTYKAEYVEGKVKISLNGSDKVTEVLIDPNDNQGGSIISLEKLNEIKNATTLDKYSDGSEITWSDLKAALTTLEGEELNAMVGKEKTVDMGSLGIHKIRIANVSSPSDVCNNPDNSETACGIVLEFSDIITVHYMNPSGEYKGTNYSSGWNKDGYPASSMHNYLSNDIYNALPPELQSIIIETKVVSSYGANDANGTGKDGNWISNDKLYLLSTREVYGSGDSYLMDYDRAYNLTRQLDYYENIGTTTNNEYGAKKQYNGSYSWWWLRTARSNNTYQFCGVDNNGVWYCAIANAAFGVSPAFRIGK